MNKYVMVLQSNLRNSSSTFLLFFLRLVAGIVVGLTLALMGEEVFGIGRLAFFFIIVTTTSVFLSITKKWGALGVGLFLMFFFMLGLLLRMYALKAPTV